MIKDHHIRQIYIEYCNGGWDDKETLNAWLYMVTLKAKFRHAKKLKGE